MGGGAVSPKFRELIHQMKIPLKMVQPWGSEPELGKFAT